VSWEGIFAYAFPPPILIPKVLMKVRQENCFSIYLEAFEENCFEDFDLQIFSTLPDLDFLDLDVMTDLCSETTGRVILVVLEEHPNLRSLNHY
jgi:hypothetical protein